MIQMNVISSKQSQIPPVLPILETFLELCVVCVCVHVHLRISQVLYYLKVQPQLSDHLSNSISFWSLLLAHSVPGTHAFLVSAAHETYSCLGPLQQLFPLSEFLILLIFLCRALPLISQIFLKYHILREVLSDHSAKSHLIMCSAITLLSVHCPNLNKICLSSIPRKMPAAQQVLKGCLLNTLKSIINSDLCV